MNITKLPPSSKVIIRTRSSTYTLEILENQRILVTGGNGNLRYPHPTHVFIIGWTPNYSKFGWLEKGGYLEILDGKKRVITTEIQAAKVVTPVGSYNLWQNEWLSDGF